MKKIDIRKTLPSYLIWKLCFCFFTKNIKLKNPIGSGNNFKTALVIQNFSALGDNIVNIAFIKSLAESFREIKIILLIKKRYSSLLIENNIFLKKYDIKIIYAHRGYLLFLKNIFKIRKYKPEIAFIPFGSGRKNIQTAMLSGCNYVLSNRQSYVSLKKCRTLSNKRSHFIKDRLISLEKLGGEKIDSRIDIALLKNKNIENKISRLLRHKDNIVNIHLGAGNIDRMWHVDNFIELSNKLMSHDKSMYISITGVSKESSIIKKAKKEISYEKRVIDLHNKINLLELGFFLKKIKLLISGDTGIMHLAIAMKCQSISLFGSTNPNRFGPIQDIHLHRIIKADFIDDITAERVFKEYKKYEATYINSHKS